MLETPNNQQAAGEKQKALMSSVFRTLTSAILVGTISIGNSLQIAFSGSQEPTEWQLYSAVIGGVVLFLNDIKSRLTPALTEEKPQA